MKPHPIFFERGQGDRLYDVDGNSYLDYVLGWGPVIVGHAHPDLVAAVERQLPRGATYGAGHRLEYEVAEMVCERIPGVERVLWSNTGTEANQIALRVVRARTGHQRFIKFAGHYHGWSDQMLLGYRPDAQGNLDRPATRGQSPEALDHAEVLPWGDLEAVRRVLADPSKDIAAIFTEPVLCNSGVIAPPEGFLQGIRALADEFGVVLVFDEVITGFRLARGGATERFGVTPDLVVLAKAIAGGFPLAAVGGRADIIEQTLAGVVHAGTYNGNPIVLAAAKATLGILDQPGVYAEFDRHGAMLADGLRDTLGKHRIEAIVNQVGPVVQASIATNDPDTFDGFLMADQAHYDRIAVELLRNGVFVLPGGRWYISTAHTDQSIVASIAAFDQAVAATEEVRRGRR
ncbi:aspartate aminotransferase family protein [Streptomyces sp. NPDC020917]|uniref:aspartate aminotransferase family protein n=1 Tax=Streptomyces sp. NPDC020917 TaxID=3365102 RepID=UPI0037AC56D2